jgi:hypothetical protein
VKEIVACPLLAVALTDVGAPGAVAGVTELLALETELVPSAFVAVTVNVYACPLVRPVTVMGDEPPVAVKPPIFEVTVYVVITEPPFETGALNEMVACPFPETATTEVGAPGVVAGVTALLVEDCVLVPAALVAVTVKVYVVPLLRPVTVIGELPAYATNPPVFEVTV